MKKKILHITLLFASALLFSCNRPDRSEIYTDYFKSKDFSGQVLIAKRGNPIFQQSFCNAEMTTNRNSMPEDTYLIDSITKQFTAFSILLLQDRGLLSVNDSIVNYYDNVPVNWSSITIHDLLSHSSGLPTFDDLESFQIDILYTGGDLIRHEELRNYPLFPKGKFRYSSIGYVLLGGIIAKVSGMDYCDFVYENIFTPLEMKNTGCIIDTVSNGISTTGYKKGDHGTFQRIPFSHMSCAQGNSNLYSNLRDLLIWDKAIREKKSYLKPGIRTGIQGIMKC